MKPHPYTDPETGLRTYMPAPHEPDPPPWFTRFLNWWQTRKAARYARKLARRGTR